MAVEPGLEYPGAVLLHHRSRQGDDGNPARPAVLPDELKGLFATDARQFQIHQNQARTAFRRKFDTMFAGPSLENLEPGVDQHVTHQLQIPLVVLDNEDPVAVCHHAWSFGAGTVATCGGNTPIRASDPSTRSRPTGLTR
jgi:hypothetical protein